MKTQDEILRDRKSQPSPTRSPGSTDLSTRGRSELAAYSASDAKNLTNGLAACMAVQRTYGRQAGDLQAIAKIFMSALGQYEPRQVIGAVHDWLLKSPEFPTPHDIAMLLADDKPLNRDVYLRIVASMRRHPETLAQWEWNYMAKYERENR